MLIYNNFKVPLCCYGSQFVLEVFYNASKDKNTYFPTIYITHQLIILNSLLKV